MEVHHHGHVHQEKKWKEYFFQFFMLFLAVFCGTLAEYWLEHRIEHNRELDFMASLVQDLQSDTAQINQNLELGNVVMRKADTLVKLLHRVPLLPEDAPLLYRLSSESTRLFDVRFEDRTAAQLKNAGGMRLVRNHAVADSIRNYWWHVQVLQGILERIDYMADKGAVLNAQLFDSKYFGERDPSNPLNAPPVSPDARLMTDDPAILAQFANWKTYRRTVSLNYLKNLTETKAQAARLAALIREEYSLD
jgi:hypothetical protein